MLRTILGLFLESLVGSDLKPTANKEQGSCGCFHLSCENLQGQRLLNAPRYLFLSSHSSNHCNLLHKSRGAWCSSTLVLHLLTPFFISILNSVVMCFRSDGIQILPDLLAIPFLLFYYMFCCRFTLYLSKWPISAFAFLCITHYYYNEKHYYHWNRKLLFHSLNAISWHPKCHLLVISTMHFYCLYNVLDSSLFPSLKQEPSKKL